jgi:hypothetical protein
MRRDYTRGEALASTNQEISTAEIDWSCVEGIANAFYFWRTQNCLRVCVWVKLPVECGRVNWVLAFHKLLTAEIAENGRRGRRDCLRRRRYHERSL